MPLLRVLGGPDGEDPGCTALELGDPGAVDLSTLTVLDVAEDGKYGVSAELRAAQESAAAVLARRGARVRRTSFPLLTRQFEIWSAMLGEAQDVPFGTMLGEGVPIPTLRELAKCAMGRSEHTAIALLLALADPVTHLLPGLTARFIEMGNRLRGELLQAMGPHGVMLYPVWPTTAPRHRAPVFDAVRLHLPSGYTGLFNVLELPATAVPLGLGDGGLPLGLQVVGPHGGDHLTIAVAMALEADLGGWVPPPMARAQSPSARS